MKKFVLAICVVLSFITVFSQNTKVEVNDNLSYGFNLGISHSIIIHDLVLPAESNVINRTGFRLGVIADYKLSKFMSLSPKAEIAFNQGFIEMTNISVVHEYDIMPVSIDFMIHTVFKKNNDSKLKPYFFAGPNFKIPLTKEDNQYFTTKSDLAIDFGIGLGKSFKYFKLLPELRYSYGILDINKNPWLSSVNFHNVSFLVSFM